MKPGIHPNYRPVVFRDRSGGLAFLTRSTRTGTGTIEWEDGRTDCVIDIDVSSASHPLWTGRTRVLDSEGRVERFRRRCAAAASKAGTGGSPGEAPTASDARSAATSGDSSAAGGSAHVSGASS